MFLRAFGINNNKIFDNDNKINKIDKIFVKSKNIKKNCQRPKNLQKPDIQNNLPS